MRPVVRLAFFFLLLVFAFGCSTAASPNLSGSSSVEGRGEASAAPSQASDSAPSDAELTASRGASRPHSPGLGTAWGERRESDLNYVNFQREDERKPEAMATIHYDNSEGIRAQSGMRHERTKGFTMLNGEVEFGLTNEESVWSPFLPGTERSGDYYVRGANGDRYAIYLRNRTDYRIEVVLSVDGLDVMNGHAASFEHRGYVIEPGEKLVVEGFRDSRNSVAAFRFADVSNSYAAEKTGDVRNVGVIGLAVFPERGSYRFASRGREQNHANPFPAEFATAP